MTADPYRKPGKPFEEIPPTPRDKRGGCSLQMLEAAQHRWIDLKKRFDGLAKRIEDAKSSDHNAVDD